jgi:hypothetical protein
VPAVNSRLFCRRRAERFAQLLDEANGGRRHHIRSAVDDDLATLVAVSDQVRDLRPDVEVDPGFRTGLRAMLVATAEREGIGVTAGPDPLGDERTGRSPAIGPGQTVFRPTLNGQRARARGATRTRAAVLVGVAAGAIAVSGMSAASENALPGDALYGMKRSTERAQLALASSDLSRGQLFLDFAQTRLAESAAVLGDGAGFGRVLDDMDADTRQGIKLLTASAVQRRDEAALDAIEKFFDGQRREVSGLLDSATRAERSRTTMSLDLLDAIKKRADALRAAFRCGAAPATRTDALGPVPQACGSNKGLTSGPPAAAEHRPAGPAAEPARTEPAGSQRDGEPAPNPEVAPTAIDHDLPRLSKPDGKPIGGKPAN